jgi:D-arabinose 1-dehydrogenase-like Zn-dependent alcohol dehydrogenase
VTRAMPPWRSATHIVVGAPYGRWIGPLARMFKALVLSGLMGRRIVAFIAKPGKEDLTIMGELMATGKVTPVIDRQYKLGEAPQAIEYLEEGHVRGKVVITLE